MPLGLVTNPNLSDMSDSNVVKSTATAMNPKIMEMNGKGITSPSSKFNTSKEDFVLDRTWAKNAFLVSDGELGSPDDSVNRYWSSASVKFTDTRMGGNIGINARPQFTRYADVREKGRLAGRNDVSLSHTSGDYGMGRYYSEAIDDPSQTIYLRFGVPQYNSLINFITRAFDHQQSQLARTGTTSYAYTAGKLFGSIGVFVAFPTVAISVWIAKLAGNALDVLFSRPTSKFYTLKPTMHNYWGAVNLLVNTYAINRRIFPLVLDSDRETQKLGQLYRIDGEYMEMFKELFPDIFRESNFFDIYAMANRAQRIANDLIKTEYDQLKNGSAKYFAGYVRKSYGGDTHGSNQGNLGGSSKVGADLNDIFTVDNIVGPPGSYLVKRITGRSYSEHIEAFISNNGWFGSNGSDPKNRVASTDPRVDTGTKNDQDIKDELNNKETDKPAFQKKEKPSYWQQIKAMLDAEFRDGSQWAVFKVDHTGSISESFSNSVVESDLSNKLNSTSSSVRSMRFSLADGNIVGDTVESAIKAGVDLVSGALSGLTFGISDFIQGLAGSGYIDIPKHWQSSSASLPRSSYSMQLISPHGNPISIIQNIYIPMFMLMAGALPLSTGKQSFTSPFLVELFDRGRCQIRLGMIDSLSFTRGTSNLPFNLRGDALAIDVSFSVTDLSSIMHMPISNGSILGFNTSLDEDNILSDYLAVLAGQDIYSQIYTIPKAELNFAKAMIKAKTLTSPAFMSSLVKDTTTSGLGAWLTLGTAKVLEGLVAGSGQVQRHAAEP